MRRHTTEPVRAGNTTSLTPEFIRVPDAQRLFGIKRGSLYALIGKGKVRSCLLRLQGQKSGVRLISYASLKNFLAEQMNEQSATATKSTTSGRAGGLKR